MKVTYVGHSGFLVETDTVSLLFDYWTGEIPPIAADKPLYILASHRHQDHYNPKIFSLPGLPKDTTYLLSYDISAKGKYQSLEKESSYNIKDLEIDTLESTDEGIAFLIRIPAEDLLIYHAGDLNWWMWDGETEADNNHYTVWFKAQVEKLAALVKKKGRNGRLDLAFFTMDPRQEIYEFYGMDWQLQCIPVDVVFPMHCSEDYNVIDRYLELRGEAIEELLPDSDNTRKQTADPKIRLAHIKKRGECYEI